MFFLAFMYRKTLFSLERVKIIFNTSTLEALYAMFLLLDHPKEFQGQKTNILRVLEAGIQWRFFLTIISVGPCVVRPLLDHKFVDLFQTSVGVIRKKLNFLIVNFYSVSTVLIWHFSAVKIKILILVKSYFMLSIPCGS